MKTLIITIFTVLFLSVNTGYSQDFEWVQDAGGNDRDNGYDVEVDALGNSYVTGIFTGTATFGPYSITSSGYNDIFLAKYDASGNIQWVRRAGGVGDDGSVGIAVDANNNLYITGNFSGNVDFGSFVLTGEGIFIAKYSSFGGIIWAINAGSATSSIKVNDIDIDNSGNSVITGYYSGTAAFSSAMMTSTGLNDVFTVKYSNTANLVWAKSGGSPGSDYANSVDVDNLGNVFITGKISTDAIFDDVTASGSDDMYIVKYDASGTALWGNAVQGTGTSEGLSIGADGFGNCIVTGTYFGSVSFGSIEKLGGNSLYHDIFIAMCNPAGIYSWVNTPIGNMLYPSLKTDNSGNSFFTGLFGGTVTFGSLTLTEIAGACIVRFDVFGNEVWAKSASGFIHPENISIYSEDFIFITGSYEGTAIFGSHSITNPPSPFSTNIFVAKLSSQNNLISGNAFIDFNNDGIKNDVDVPYQNGLIFYTGGLNPTITNGAGDFKTKCGLGNFDMSIPYPPRYHNVNPAIQSASFSSFFNTDQNNNFALSPVPNMNDLRVITGASLHPVPGRDMVQLIMYKNNGTTIQSGYVEFTYDSRLTLLTAQINPPPDESSGNILKWYFSNLPSYPTGEGNINVRFNVPAGISVGTILTFTANIIPVTRDQTPLDNTSIINQPVVASYDPNDKSVEPSGNISTQQVIDETDLTYTVHFQNIGNNEAYNIVVIDTLSSKLNIPSFEMLSASHNYTYKIKENGIVEWTFANILLPYKDEDELGSNGFIKYRIKPKTNLVKGDEIENTAYIYFDFNEPIITNTTSTKVGLDLDLKFRLEALYPIPDVITIYLANSVSPFEIIESATVNSQLDGTLFKASALFGNAQSGSSYYVIVEHRNSIRTWSAAPVIFNSGITEYNFTTSIAQAYGNNMINNGGVASFYSGDVNQNGTIDLSDVLQIYNDVTIFATGAVTDLDGNGMTDLTDMLIAKNNATNFIQVIRP